MNYRICTGPTPITRGPTIDPLSEPDTTTDYYGMDCRVFLREGYKIIEVFGQKWLLSNEIVLFCEFI